MPIILKKFFVKSSLRVWIDPTNVCDFKCTFCPTGDDDLLKSLRPKGQMTMKLTKK